MIVRGVSRRQLFTLDFEARRRPAGHWVRVHRTAMACRFEVTLSSEDARFVPAARLALDEADRIEAALTLFRDTSELMRVNRHAATGPAPITEELFAVLRLCRTLSDSTHSTSRRRHSVDAGDFSDARDDCPVRVKLMRRDRWSARSSS